MSYSDLLADQDKELERLHQEYYADQATIKNLQKGHFDQSRFDGQLDRLKVSFESKVKEVQSRFAQEQREYLGEPVPPAPLPDISQSQDKAVDMIKAYRQRPAEKHTGDQRDTDSGQVVAESQSVKGQPVDETEVKRLAQEAREKRQQKQQQYRRGFKR